MSALSPAPLPRIVRRVIIDFPGDSTTDSRPLPLRQIVAASSFFFFFPHTFSPVN